MDPQQPFTVAARWVVPVEGDPLRDACVTIQEGRITAIGPARGRRVERDFGAAVIIPGLVNAHTHLELPRLDNAPPGDALASPLWEDQIDWLKRVVAWRRANLDPADHAARVAGNLAAAIQSGTTVLADTSAGGLSWDMIAASPIHAIIYAEIIGLRNDRATETTRAAASFLHHAQSRPAEPGRCLHTGLSPHAPYSTRPALYGWAVFKGVPLSTHLAELPEERELLSSGRGRLRDFLDGIDAWTEQSFYLGASAAEGLANARGDWLLAHGTDLSDDEIDLLVHSTPPDCRRSVAYCPRTHARFREQSHPFARMIGRGLPVCLGTDSLASAPSLSLLDEMRFLFRLHDAPAAAQILRMATLDGAWALRADGLLGSLRPGKSADLAVIGLEDPACADPVTDLLASRQPVAAVMCRGQFVHGA